MANKALFQLLECLSGSFAEGVKLFLQSPLLHILTMTADPTHTLLPFVTTDNKLPPPSVPLKGNINTSAS